MGVTTLLWASLEVVTHSINSDFFEIGQASSSRSTAPLAAMRQAPNEDPIRSFSPLHPFATELIELR